MACSDRKHRPGEPCDGCAPCGFGCSPCLGSVSWDMGDCGAAVFMLPLSDPCDSFADNEPYCRINDCMVEDCEHVGDFFICTSTTIILGVTSVADIYVRVIQQRAYSYSIQVMGNKKFRLRAQSRIAKRLILVADYECTDGVSSFTCARPAFNCTGYNDFSANIPCDADEFLQFPAVYCGTFDTFTGLVCVGSYEVIVELVDCEDFLGTFTLDRTNAGCGTQTKTIDVRGGYVLNAACQSYGITCRAGDCTGCNTYDLTLVDCFPATLDVTLA